MKSIPLMFSAVIGCDSSKQHVFSSLLQETKKFFSQFLENDDFITVRFLPQVMETKHFSERSLIAFGVFEVGDGRRNWMEGKEDFVEKGNGKEQTAGILRNKLEKSLA